MRIQIFVLTIASLFVCSSSLVLSQELSELRSLVDPKPMVIFETKDASAIFEQVENLDIAKHRGWGNIVKLIDDPNFGLTKKFSLDSIGVIKKQLIDDIRPQQLICSLNSRRGKIQWRMLFRSRSSDTEEAILNLFSSVADFQLQKLIDSGEKTAIVEKCKIVREVSGVRIYCFDALDLHWFSNNQLVVLTGSQEEAVRIAGQVTNPVGKYRSINESRAYLGVANMIRQAARSNRNAAASLSIQVDPSVVALFFGSLDEKQTRAIGLDEIVGIGVSLNIFDSATQAGASEFVANGFIKSTEPRLGIADAIRLKGKLTKLPSLPNDRVLFAYVNFDYQHFHEQKKLLFDRAFGDGAYPVFLGGGRRAAKLLDESLMDNYAHSLGDVHGACWYTKDDAYEISYF